ncbi:MAG: DUF4040 domain-containing protein [Clostridia bacterium]|nr:DUF4040 domain-containing protein [Clostridia bacterium]
MEALNIILLIFIIGCAVAVAFSKNLLRSIVLFMSMSLALSVVWVLLESPDLAITEAAVGAGIDSLLMFATLKKIHAIDLADRHKESVYDKEVAEDGKAQA